MQQLPCSVIILARPLAPLAEQARQSVPWAAEVQIVINQSISDFSQVRNQAMSRAAYDWVFFLDSDEQVVADETSLVQLTQLLSSDDAGALTIKRSDVFLGKVLSHGEAGNQIIARFVRKGRGQWQNAVHEVWQSDAAVLPTSLELKHFSHNSLFDFIVDVSRYAQLVAADRPASSFANLLQLLCFPPAKLVYDLVILQGVRDGWRGVIYAYCMALHSLLVRIFRYEKSTALVRR